MDIHNADGWNVILDFKQTVKFVRIIGNTLTATEMKITAEVIPDEECDDLDLEVAFAKIRFWFESIVSRSVAMSRNNALGYKLFTDELGKVVVSNYLMITPNEPSDDHLATLFQSKMEAFAGSMVSFGAIRVDTSSPNGLVCTYMGAWRDDLPAMEEWFPTKPYFFDTPWWTRADVSTLDVIAVDVTDFETKPSWAMELNFIEDAIRPRPVANGSANKPDTDANDAPETVVIKGSFRPIIVDRQPDE